MNIQTWSDQWGLMFAKIKISPKTINVCTSFQYICEDKFSRFYRIFNPCMDSDFTVWYYSSFSTKPVFYESLFLSQIVIHIILSHCDNVFLHKESVFWHVIIWNVIITEPWSCQCLQHLCESDHLKCRKSWILIWFFPETNKFNWYNSTSVM